MIVDLVSFSFRSNNIPESNYLIDVRFINNPFYVDELRGLGGLDSPVINFFEKDKNTKAFLKELYRWIEFIIKANKAANKEKIVIAIGCTGGQHRSPYIVECLGKFITKNGLASEVSIHHKILKKYNVCI